MSSMKPERRILVIENSVDVTGALKSITRTEYDLRSFFSFYFIHPQKSAGRPWVEAKGFKEIHELPMIELGKRPVNIFLYLPRLFQNAARLKRLIKQERIDIVHVNDFYNLLPVVLRLLASNTPYLCHVRFLPDRFPRLLVRFWCWLHIRYASKIIAVSEKVKSQLPKHPKVVVIPNELPVEERHPYVPETATSKGSYTFLYLSNYINGKGQNFALQAFANVHQRLPNWTLRFVGSDMGLSKNKAYKESLVYLVETLGIGHKVSWHGYVEDVEREYKNADIVLNFSESESFSITCVEALYFGRPLIATDCGGPAEIIDHDITGLLVANRSVEKMANAMLRLATDANLRCKLANQGRIGVSEKFSIEKTSLKLKSVYEEVLNLRR
jgi:glycosyltransferase involved in cell wall biosynthesis